MVHETRLDGQLEHHEVARSPVVDRLEHRGDPGKSDDLALPGSEDLPCIHRRPPSDLVSGWFWRGGTSLGGRSTAARLRIKRSAESDMPLRSAGVGPRRSGASPARTGPRRDPPPASPGNTGSQPDRPPTATRLDRIRLYRHQRCFRASARPLRDGPPRHEAGGRCHVRRQDSSNTATVTTSTTTDANRNKINRSSATGLTSLDPVVGARNDGQHLVEVVHDLLGSGGIRGSVVIC